MIAFQLWDKGVLPAVAKGIQKANIGLNPNIDGGIVRVPLPEIEVMAQGATSVTGVGGMISKISAARLAPKAGCASFIANGAETGALGKTFSPRGDASKSCIATIWC